MDYRRRVTLRCLCDDLTTDWGDVGQRRGYAVLRDAIAQGSSDGELSEYVRQVPTPVLGAHPLIMSFAAAFVAVETAVQRESISGLRNPHWWKQKVARWRGAATDAEVVGEGEVWLCGGGLRAAGEPRDFYAKFMKSVEVHGPERFLPSDADRRYQEVEEKLARFEAWLEQIRLSALVALHQCTIEDARRQVHVPVPFPARVADPLAHLTFEIERATEDDGELIELLLSVHVDDHARDELVWCALEAAQSVIEPMADAWTVLPGRDADQVWSVLVPSEAMARASECVETGVLSESVQTSAMRLGVQAHYARRDLIVDASVDGDAVRGLCGTWFVPTSDPDVVPVCPTCVSARERLSG